jgi:hypothetical protein
VKAISKRTTAVEIEIEAQVAAGMTVAMSMRAVLSGT